MQSGYDDADLITWNKTACHKGRHCKDQTDPKKNLKHIDSHISILCSTGETFQSPKPFHIILCTVPTVMEACLPSPETVKALDVTSFTVNLFSTDEILALQSKATSAKNFAVLSVQHDCVQAF